MPTHWSIFFYQITERKTSRLINQAWPGIAQAVPKSADENAVSMRFDGSGNPDAGHSNQCGWLDSFGNPLKLASVVGGAVKQFRVAIQLSSIYSNEIMRKV